MANGTHKHIFEQICCILTWCRCIWFIGGCFTIFIRHATLSLFVIWISSSFLPFELFELISLFFRIEWHRTNTRKFIRSVNFFTEFKSNATQTKHTRSTYTNTHLQQNNTLESKMKVHFLIRYWKRIVIFLLVKRACKFTFFPLKIDFLCISLFLTTKKRINKFWKIKSDHNRSFKCKLLHSQSLMTN